MLHKRRSLVVIRNVYGDITHTPTCTCLIKTVELAREMDSGPTLDVIDYGLCEDEEDDGGDEVDGGEREVWGRLFPLKDAYSKTGVCRLNMHDVMLCLFVSVVTYKLCAVHINEKSSGINGIPNFRVLVLVNNTDTFYGENFCSGLFLALFLSCKLMNRFGE